MLISPSFGDLDAAEDRSWIAQHRYFLKRKFMNTGHGKNFLAGSLVNQHYYFDEMEERVQFPAMFPVALLSCALLEKAKQDNYAFETNPVVYTSHHISVDRRLLHTLKSNDRLYLLVTVSETVPAGKGLGEKGFPQQLHRCFGLLSNTVLFSNLLHYVPYCCDCPNGLRLPFSVHFIRPTQISSRARPRPIHYPVYK